VAPQIAAKYAAIVATGRSDFPNQINNVLAFPGIFRGALDARATTITERMKVAAADAIAAVVADDLRADAIVPSPLDPRVAPAVAAAVIRAAERDGVARLLSGAEYVEPEPVAAPDAGRVVAGFPQRRLSTSF
jgi:malate dehydrogenase (oxaloacetate-decarboxylating)